MTPKEQANKLIYRFQNECISDEENKGINFILAKQCALIAIEMILNYDNYHRNDYWGQVKLEILNNGLNEIR
jgi:hypothetical protein